MGSAYSVSRQTRVRRVVYLLVLATFSIFLIFPPYQSLAVTGPYAVATASYTYIDDERIEQFSNSGENRRVNVAFWYPQTVGNDEKHPLVVFSHGGLGLQSSNESLYRELASHGYVVCAIGHPYHAFWTRGEDSRFTVVSVDYFRELQREDAKGDKEQSFRFYSQWMAVRTGDINFVIDTILEKTAVNNDVLYSLIDIQRIGVMGHSLGGAAALAMPRQRADIDAVVALESPFMYDIVGVENAQFVFTNEPYPVPILNIYSDSAWSHLTEWPQYARNYDLLWSLIIGLYLLAAYFFFPNTWLLMKSLELPPKDVIMSTLLFRSFFPGFGEEILFRGFFIALLSAFVLTGDQESNGRKIGIIVLSSLYFALAHVYFTVAPFRLTHIDYQQLVTAFASGAFYAAVYLKTKSLLAPFLAHNFSNTSATICAYIISVI